MMGDGDVGNNLQGNNIMNRCWKPKKRKAKRKTMLKKSGCIQVNLEKGEP